MYKTYIVSSHLTFILKRRRDECILFLSLLSLNLPLSPHLILSSICVFYSQNVNKMYAKSDDIVTAYMRFVCHRILLFFFSLADINIIRHTCVNRHESGERSCTHHWLTAFRGQNHGRHSFCLFIVGRMERTAIIVCRIGYNIRAFSN